MKTPWNVWLARAEVLLVTSWLVWNMLAGWVLWWALPMGFFALCLSWKVLADWEIQQLIEERKPLPKDMAQLLLSLEA
jgi:hypothetical protein